ncbi:IS1 family transposase [Clostridium sp. D46t1_190503_E9]|uniref:IS1 family transposase n=1 Tax=Clostridium sp. D46t1_190503_E9 TaxID=2787137 RepID=UPI00189B4934|nr:IS1 family transposase [Clostridium sp. D46t1_190503_E9]
MKVSSSLCSYANCEINSKFKQVDLYLNELSIIDILKDKEIRTCPNCNSNNFIKYGKYRGLQRFKCLNKNCGKTFSKKTNSIFSNSKKPLDLWLKYLILMNNEFSLRKCSAILGINLATSFYWRHKFLITQTSNNYNILKNYVEISKIIIKENFKGDRKARYYNKENIFIACAMDSNKSLISKAISRRSISLEA